MTVADVVAAGLRRAGVTRVFVADEPDPRLLEAARAVGLSLIATVRAASAGAMASVAGRLGEAPGVAIVARDDPATTRALACAMAHHAPVIVVASRAPLDAPTKSAAAVSADSAAHWVAHAAHAAMGEPPGPVWLTVTPEIAARPSLPIATAVRLAEPPLASDELDALAEQIGVATRPLLVAGRACRARATAAWLRAFAEALPAPVLVTPAARGALPDPHPLSLGLLAPDSAILARADLVVALGVDDAEVAAVHVTLPKPMTRIERVAAVLEDLAPRLRDRARADWDVAELDRLRRARSAPDVPPALAQLVVGLRDATPAGTAAVFAPALEAATPLWQAVQPGDVLVEDDVIAASAAVALERPESAVLAFGSATRDASTELARTGIRLFTPSPSGLAGALGDVVAASGPRVLVVPPPA